MPQEKQPRLVQQVTTPQHFVPPSVREMRAQAVHRLQVGLFGLAAMLLLVSLASIIMERARLAEEVQVVESVVASSAPKTSKKKAASDPLADIGVVPSADPSASAADPQAR